MKIANQRLKGKNLPKPMNKPLLLSTTTVALLEKTMKNGLRA